MSESATPERSNILILLSDQHRADAFSCNDHPVVRTPNLDSLAAEGVQFSNAYTQSPLCVPARASMYLGVYPHNTQVRDFSSWVPDHATTVFEHLQESGYYTAHIGEADGKTWLTTEDGEDLRDNQEFLENMGFDYVHQTIDPWKSRTIDSPVTDYWEDEGLLETARSDLTERYSEAREYDLWEEGGFSVNWPSPLDAEDHLDGYTCRQAIAFIEGYDREQPFALFVGIPGPHEPLDPPAEYAEMYDPAEMPDSIPPAEHGDWIPEEITHFVDHEIGKRPDFDPAQIREVQAAYYAKISHIDHWIGEIIDALDSNELREETLTIYTSDHGELAGDHARVAKHCFFEPSVRIPMIVSQPGNLPQGETSTALAELIDLYPTALAVADVMETGNTFGSSLLRAAQSPENPHASDRQAVMSVFHDRVMYLTREYKYAIDGNGRGYMLYDRANDPEEQENLIGHPEHEETERAIREQLLQFYHRTSTRYRRNGDGFRVVSVDRERTPNAGEFN